MTQSETYSSSPWRVSVPCPAFAGDDRGHALVLQPAEQAAQLGAQDGLVATSRRRGPRSYPAPPAWRRWSRWRAQADEQPFQVVLAGLFDLAALDVDMIDEPRPLPVVPDRSRARRRFRSGLRRFPRRPQRRPARQTPSPRAPEIPWQRGFAAAGAADQQRGAALGQPAIRDFIEPLNAGGTIIPESFLLSSVILGCLSRSGFVGGHFSSFSKSRGYRGGWHASSKLVHFLLQLDHAQFATDHVAV